MSFHSVARFKSAGPTSCHSRLKSTHAGFAFSIKAIFYSLRQPFKLFLSTDSFPEILIRLEPDQPIAIIFFSKAFVLFPFVFEDAPA